MKISKPFQLTITAIIILAIPFTIMVSKTNEEPQSNASEFSPTAAPIIFSVSVTQTPTVSCAAKGGKCIAANVCHLQCSTCSSYYGCLQGQLCCLTNK